MLMQEKEIPILFSVQSKPLHCCEEHNKSYNKTIKAEITTLLQNRCFMQLTLCFFFVLLPGSTYIFISGPFDFYEVIFKKFAFHFPLW